MYVLTGYKPLWKALGEHQSAQFNAGDGRRIVHPPDDVCLLTDGTVCEFRGWKRYVERLHEPNAKASSLGHPDSYMTIVHPFCTPIHGPTIATADQLGGEAWLEWLRSEGLL